MELANIVPALITGAVALAAGPIFSYFMSRSNAAREAETVKASIIAEISGVLDLIYSREYLKGLKAGAEGILPGLLVDVPDSYFQVYRANLTKLGLLNAAVAENIVYFYMLLEAVKQDVKPGGPLNSEKVDSHERIEAFVTDVELLSRALEIGETLRGR